MAKIEESIILKYPDYKNYKGFLDNHAKIILSNINPLEFFKLDKTNILDKIDLNKYVKTLFVGKAIKIPNFKIKEDLNNFNRFEEFTSKNEVKQISLWALSCLNYLSSGKDIRLGKELEIIQTSNPRDGRLDVVVLNDKEIIIMESKVNLTSLLNEGRFKLQIPEYQKECQKLSDKHNLSIFLLIGGEETDLYPPRHPDCTTGQVGNVAKIFYDNLIRYKIKFISANALWALYAYSLINKKKAYWKDILPKVFKDEKVLGLLSGGKVINEGSNMSLEPLY